MPPSFQEALLKESGLSLEEYEAEVPSVEDAAPVEETPSDEETISHETSSEEESEESDEQESSEEEEAQVQAKEDDVEDVEYVYATGPKGRKKIKVDYSNRDLVKRAFQKAVAADLYRHERDATKKTQDEWKEKVETFERLNEAFSSKGAEGVLELLAGPEGVQTWLQQKIDERERLANMTPEEKRQLEVQQTIQEKETRAERLERELQEIRQRMEKQAEESRTKELESIVYPAYERYNFDGKLGNEQHEYRLNRLMWQQAEEAIEALPEDTPLTKALADRIYRDAARDVQSLIGERAKVITKKAAVKRKVAATEAAQTAATKGMSPQSKQSKLQKAMDTGDISSAMSLFFRR